MAIMVWHDVFFNNVKDSVFRAALAVITKERSGQTVNRGLLKSVIASFGMGVVLNDHFQRIC